MAKLILTEAEKAAHSWLDLDDASLGKLVKASAVMIADNDDNRKNVYAVTCAIMLASLAHQANADNLTIDCNGVTRKGEKIGNWKVTAQCIDTSEESAEKS